MVGQNTHVPLSAHELREYMDSQIHTTAFANSEPEYQIYQDASKEAVRLMPPWAQGLLVANESPITNEKYDPWWHESPHIMGQCNNDMVSIIAEKLAPEEMHWVLYHEVGHAIDYLLGYYLHSSNYYSNIDLEWDEAFKKDQELYQTQPPAALPYPQYQNIFEHLKSKKPDAHRVYAPYTYATESFAKLSEYYFTLYRSAAIELLNQNSDASLDEAAIDAKISPLIQEAYPHLWPIFHDKVIPLAKEKAAYAMQENIGAIEAKQEATHSPFLEEQLFNCLQQVHARFDARYHHPVLNAKEVRELAHQLASQPEKASNHLQALKHIASPRDLPVCDIVPFTIDNHIPRKHIPAVLESNAELNAQADHVLTHSDDIVMQEGIESYLHQVNDVSVKAAYLAGKMQSDIEGRQSSSEAQCLFAKVDQVEAAHAQRTPHTLMSALTSQGSQRDV